MGFTGNIQIQNECTRCKILCNHAVYCGHANVVPCTNYGTHGVFELPYKVVLAYSNMIIIFTVSDINKEQYEKCLC